VALDDLSLTVPSGEFVAILGPNSAGKTTLVKVLATLLRPTGGNATVNGFDVARQASRVRASIAVVPAAGWLAFDGGLSLGASLMYWIRPHHRRR
jgi:ABC-2 type transport system ATP-binding protein